MKEFDLMERIVPDEIRAVPTPSEEEAHRELLRRAARSLGVAAAADIVDYRLPKRPARERLAELVEAGELEAVSVEGWNLPAVLHPEATLPRAIEVHVAVAVRPGRVVRERGERLFDFEYKLEIYTPAAKRKFGYYVLPFLMGDRIAGRLDGKTDRGERRFACSARLPSRVPTDLTAEEWPRSTTSLPSWAWTAGASREQGELIEQLRRHEGARR